MQCSRCGTPIDPTRAVYSTKTAMLVCASCEASETVDTGYSRAGASVSFGALSAGLLANSYFCCIPSFVTIIFGVVGIAAGIRAIGLVNRPEYRGALGSKYGLYLTVAIIGLVLAAIGTLMSGLGLLGLAVGTVHSHR
jgi:hypothetical protein